MLLLVLIGYAILTIYDYVPLYKQKLWRDFWVNAGLGLVSLAVVCMLCLDVDLPSPAAPIRKAIAFIFGK